jgi:hypothetical protein
LILKKKSFERLPMIRPNVTPTSMTLSLPEILQRQDAINDGLSSAVAIIDCVRVLSQLERSAAFDLDSFSGQGSVNGLKVRDGSMPLALYHAMSLIGSAQASSQKLAKFLLDGQNAAINSAPINSDQSVDQSGANKAGTQ